MGFAFTDFEEEISKMRNFSQTLADHQISLTPLSVNTLQMNITRLCNQACKHCHVDASPKRREMMSDRILEQAIEVLSNYPQIQTLDITGGAPELHPRFKDMVTRARRLRKNVMVRHNLTVTLDPHPMTRESMEDLPAFFSESEVEIVSSLPFYRSYFTNKQRGPKVFEKSVESLQRLNAVGFGQEDSNLKLHLVYNPVGTYLPPEQASLEREYKQALDREFGIRFNSLFVITNMPIHRFKVDLERTNQYEEYMEKLWSSFNPTAAEGVMCRSMLSVDHEGRIFDCDFNQMLGMKCQKSQNESWDLFNFRPEEFLKREIRLGEHCFGCTAGAGSSCGGETA